MSAYKPCKWLETRDAKRITKDQVFLCSWPIPERTLPVSITKAYGFRNEPQRAYVGKADCAECPCFQAEDPAP